MNRRTLRVALIATMLPTLGGLAAAQTISGPPTQQFGTYEKSLSDSIDVAHIQVGFSVPVVNKPERGVPIDVTLGFGSIAWARKNNAWTPSGVPDGMAADAPVVGQFSSSIYEYDCTDYYGNPYYFNVYGGFNFVDPAGEQVDFGNFSIEDEYPIECDPNEDPGYPQGSGTATSANGWTITARTDGTVTITSPTGIAMSGWNPTNPADDAVTLVDRNGNEMTQAQGAGYFVDNLGDRGLEYNGSPQSGPLIYWYMSQGGLDADASVSYQAFTLQTNFQCSGIAEYSGAVHLPVNVTLPDGTYYAITYEQTPGYGAGYTTGRITSLQLPTGATITYAYPATEPNDDINCGPSSEPYDGAGRTLKLIRATPDGATTYTASTEAVPALYTTLQLTTVTDPEGNVTVETFAPDGHYFMLKKQVYSGASTLLSTEDVCYSQPLATCNDWLNPAPVYIEDRVTLPNGMMRETKTEYGSAGQTSAVYQSAWYTSGDPVWARATLMGYTGLGPAHVPFLTSKKVEDGAGNVVAETDYAYDQFGVAASSAGQHETGINYGNVTTITSHVSASATLTKTIHYYDTGEPSLVTDANGSQTAIGYGCGDALPITEQRVGDSGYDEQMAWDCGLEAMTSKTDANGVTTAWTYGDQGYALPTGITHSGGLQTTITYTRWTGPGTSASIESTTSFNGGNSVEDDLTTLDWQGRKILVQRKNPGAGTWDTVGYSYDQDGRPYGVTSPQSAGPGQQPVSPATYTYYDGAGRVIEQQTNADGGWVQYVYNANDVLVERGPAPAGEQVKQRELEYDALGRLTSVCEVTAGTSTAPAGACGQTTSQTGYLTRYSYNLLDQITAVTQNAQAASASQETRSFSYDELGRLTQETGPEAGTTSFWRDAPDGAQCTAASAGDLVEREDANGNFTCYAYDARHRLTAVTYPSGPNAGATADKYFVYDAATVDAHAMADGVGRLVEAYTGSASNKITDLGFSYTAFGQVAAAYQESPDSDGWYTSSASYYANGAPSALALPGAPAISYGLDGEGRVNAVNAGSAALVAATGTGYSPLGLTSIRFGSGDSDSFDYNSVLSGKMDQYQATVGSHTDTGMLRWSADGSLAELSVSDTIPGTNDDGTLCTYAEDDLGRLASADCGAGKSQTFSYDAFGNMSTGSSSSSFYPFSASFDLKNQVSSVGTVSNPPYDNDGDLEQDPVNGNAYTYNAEGRVVSIAGAAVIYDALGRAVEGGGKELVYGPGGGMIATMNGQVSATATVPLPGGAAAVYAGGTLAYYRHADGQGSARLESTPAQGLYGAAQYAAFGQPFATAGSVAANFTGQPQMYGAGLYNFPMRNLSPVQRRWLTPDPSGLGAVDPANPQSWNAYSYVNGDPLEQTDPLGLDPCPATTTALTYCVNVVGPAPKPPPAPLTFDPGLDWLFKYYRDPDLSAGNSTALVGVLRAGRSLAISDFAELWNGVKSAFGYDPNNPLPSCFGDVFAKTAVDDLNPFSLGPGDAAKATLAAGAAVKYNQALDYAASKALTSPFKSSIFRDIVGSSHDLAKYSEDAPAFGIAVAVLHGFVREMRALNKGACQ